MEMIRVIRRCKMTVICLGKLRLTLVEEVARELVENLAAYPAGGGRA